jgi:type II secretory pathway component GspD/PulD (secretin)
MRKLFLYAFMCVFILGWPLTGLAQDPASDSSDEEQEHPPAIRELTLEPHVVHIVLNDEHRQGIDWEAIVSDFHTIQLKKAENPVWVDKKYKVSVGTISNEDYAVLLDALDTVGKMTQVPQGPVILKSDAQHDLNIASNLKVEILLTNTKGETRLHLQPTVGVFLKDSGNPVAMTLKAHTDVGLKEDTTIVIGSITSEQEITRMHKFPLLGDLPLVGLVFRNRGRLMQKTETIIFLTARSKH